MKRYIILIITVLALVIMPNVKADDLPEVTDHEKVKIYLFRGEGCSHCYDFLTYFIDEFKEYENYFEIVVYESWNNSDNQELMLAVKEKVGEEPDAGVPFIVVGEDYHLLGFGDDSGEEIIKEALKSYEDNKYTDIVANIIKEENLNPKSETIVKAASSEGVEVDSKYLEEEGITSEYDKDSGISDTVVVAIVFGVIILGFGGLVVLSRK